MDFFGRRLSACAYYFGMGVREEFHGAGTNDGENPYTSTYIYICMRTIPHASKFGFIIPFRLVARDARLPKMCVRAYINIYSVLRYRYGPRAWARTHARLTHQSRATVDRLSDKLCAISYSVNRSFNCVRERERYGACVLRTTINEPPSPPQSLPRITSAEIYPQTTPS